MSQKIGPRELALRAQREAAAKPGKTVREIAGALRTTSSKKPVKQTRGVK